MNSRTPLIIRMAILIGVCQGLILSEAAAQPPTPNGSGPTLASTPCVAPERPSEPRVIDITELEAIALANNPTLVQASQRVAALQGRQLQVGLLPNPHIGYAAEDMGEEGSAGKQGIFVQQQIVTANKLGLNRAVASHEVQQARRELDMQRLRVLNAVRARACDAIVAQREVKLSEQLVSIGNENVDAVKQLLQAQEVSQVDLLQARVEANSAKVCLTDARNTHKAAWRRLAIVLGTPEMAPAAVADDLEEGIPEFDWDSSVQRLLLESPELARALAGVERARCALARAKAGSRPDIDVEAGVHYYDVTDDTIASVGVAVPLQIFDRNQGDIYSACAELTAAQREVRRVELSLQDRLAAAFGDYDNAREQVRQYRSDILPDAASSLNLVRTGYQQGEFGYLELLTAQRTYFRVNLQYLQSLHGLWISAIQIDGLLLDEGLAAPGQ